MLMMMNFGSSDIPSSMNFNMFFFASTKKVLDNVTKKNM